MRLCLSVLNACFQPNLVKLLFITVTKRSLNWDNSGKLMESFIKVLLKKRSTSAPHKDVNRNIETFFFCHCLH